MPPGSATPRLLRPPGRWWGYALTIAVGVLATVLWSIGATWALLAVGGETSPAADLEFFRTWRELAVIWPVVGLDELIFRAPLAIPAAFGLDRLLAPMVAALSILFGLAHGDGLPHVLIQGGDGIILSFVFLRCGGLHQHPIRGWSCATVAHGLYHSAFWLAAYFSLPAGS